MKKLRFVIVLSGAMFLFAACEEAIDLKDKKITGEECCHDEAPPMGEED